MDLNDLGLLEVDPLIILVNWAYAAGHLAESVLPALLTFTMRLTVLRAILALNDSVLAARFVIARFVLCVGLVVGLLKLIFLFVLSVRTRSWILSSFLWRDVPRVWRVRVL